MVPGKSLGGHRCAFSCSLQREKLLNAVPHQQGLTLSRESLFNLGDEDWLLMHPECVFFLSMEKGSLGTETQRDTYWAMGDKNWVPCPV